jgi:hypothetical protein
MKIALFLDIIGRDKTFSEHGFQVSGVRFQAGSRVFTPDTSCETTFDECGSRNVECGRMESLRSVFLVK